MLQRRGVSPTDSDDFIQEAFQRPERYRRDKDVQNPEGFVMRTAINIAIDAARRQCRVSFADEPVEAYAIVDESPRPDEVYASRGRLERLNEGFAALDPITQQMIRAQRMEAVENAEMSEETGDARRRCSGTNVSRSGAF